MCKDKLKEIVQNFNIDSPVEAIVPFGNGNINTTFKITLESKKSYILQKINKYVFKQPEDVVENITRVIDYIGSYELSFIKTKNNKNFYLDDDNEYYRMYKFIESSTTYDKTDNQEIIYNAGKAFGSFIKKLDSYPVYNLHTTIKDFHNTKKRYDDLINAFNNSSCKENKLIKGIVEELLSFKDIATRLSILEEKQQIKTRVIHNDTKLNNVLFDANSNNYICVIDLDTIMEGLVAYDYGDALRSIASTKDETSIDFQNIHIDLEKTKSFTKGFISETKNILTKEEKESLIYGVISMPVELSLRFLTDYLLGNPYFKIKYQNQNLDRCLNQLYLAKDILKNIDSIKKIIEEKQ